MIYINNKELTCDIQLVFAGFHTTVHSQNSLPENFFTSF